VARPSQLRRRALLRDLECEDETRRWTAAKELSSFGDPRTRDLLVRMLRDHDDRRARGAAAYTLGFAGYQDAAPVLAGVLSDVDENVEVRAYAAEALGHLLPGAPVLAPVRTAILAALRDESPEIRFWSAFAAGVLGLQEARRQLAALAETDHRLVRGWWSVAEEAEWALRLLDGEEDPPLPERRDGRG
jgi:HEAT repeat protein